MENDEFWQASGGIGTLMQCWLGCNMLQLLQKTVWQLLSKLNIELPCDPAVLLLHVYPKELKLYVQTKACTRMFVAALFIIVKEQKLPECPSTNEWISKIQDIHIMQYYSPIRKQSTENIPSERSQIQKAIYCMLPFT